MLIDTILTLAAYLLGSVPFGYIISRYMFGLDIQKVGSGNIGATNVFRNLGWRAGLLTAAGDLGKGMLPVLLARFLGAGPFWTAVVGLAAVLGHCFPLFLRFRGGKGVSTTVAALLVIEPYGFLIFGVLWLAVAFSTGRISLASLGAAAGTPVLLIVLGPAPPGLLFFSWAAAVIIFLRHHENVERLLRGDEPAVFEPGRLKDKILTLAGRPPTS